MASQQSIGTTLAATQFLNELERLRLCSDESLPVPFVMRRISDLLLERLSDKDHQEVEVAVQLAVDRFYEDLTLHETTAAAAQSLPTPPSTPAPAAADEGPCPIDRFMTDLETLGSLEAPLYADIQYLECEKIGSSASATNAAGCRKVIKEIALTCEGTDTVAWITVLPPSDALPVRSNDYVQDELRGIRWDDGQIGEEELLLAVGRLLNGTPERGYWPRQTYVKGAEKVKVIVEKFRAHKMFVDSLDNLPRLDNLRGDYEGVHEACPIHEPFTVGTPCARRHALALKARHLEQMQQEV